MKVLILTLASLLLIISPITHAEKGGNGGKVDLDAMEARVDYLEQRLADTDLDGDRYSPMGGDCDDTNTLISPALIEKLTAGNLTDGIDNDCDGTIDNARIDSDGDTYVAASDGGLDCDDSDATIFPQNSSWYTVVGDHDCDGDITLRWTSLANINNGTNPVCKADLGWINAAPSCGVSGDFVPSSVSEFYAILGGAESCLDAAIRQGLVATRTQECQ